MLLNITMAAHPIAAAVTAIVTVGQCCRRKCLAGMQQPLRLGLPTGYHPAASLDQAKIKGERPSIAPRGVLKRFRAVRCSKIGLLTSESGLGRVKTFPC